MVVDEFCLLKRVAQVMSKVELVLLDQLLEAGFFSWQIYFEIVTLQAKEHIVVGLLDVNFSDVTEKIFFVLW